MSILQLARADRTVLTLIRVRRLCVRARDLFPANRSLQEKWVQARLLMRRYGCRRPRVLIGCQSNSQGERA